MLTIILSASFLVATTVILHAVGLALLLNGCKRWHSSPLMRFWKLTGLLIRVTWCLILIHLLEISVWGFFFLWCGCMPDAETSFYFAGVTYTTIGYGDLVLTKPWRLLAPIAGLTGILMGALSTGFFFAVVSRIYQSRLVEASELPNAERTPR